MMRRLMVSMAIAGLPLVALADTSGLQQTGATGVSSQDSTVLQPATTGASTTAPVTSSSQTGDASTSAAQDLQQGAATDQQKVLVEGEADQPHQLGGGVGITWLGYVVIILLVACAATGAIWYAQRRKMQQISS